MNNMKKLIILPAAIALLALVLFLGIRIEPEADTLNVLYGSPVTAPDAQASFFGKDMHDHLIVSDDIDPEHTGTYHITYRLEGIPLKSARVTVNILDVEAPVIEPETYVLFVRTGEEASLPAYTVTDNYSTPEEITVQMSDDFDTAVPGVYSTRLSAEDTAGNLSSATIRIVVGEISEDDFLPGNFNLFDYDTQDVCYQRVEPSLTDRELNSIYFIGDSNFVNMAEHHSLPADHILARFALAPGTFDLPVFYNNEQTNENAEYWIRRLQPEHILITMGHAEVAAGDPLALADAYEKKLEILHDAAPDAQIVVATIFPVNLEITEAGVTQAMINKANYCLLRMCERTGTRMINTGEYFIDPNTGIGFKNYYLADGFHINAGYYPVYNEYIKDTYKFE